MVVAAEPIEKKTGVWVTYQSAPAWMVGEDGETRDLTAPDRTVLVGDDHYTDDYAGRIQSIRKKGRERTRGFWRSKRFSVTAAQVEDVRGRRVKVEDGALVPVRDEDKWGNRMWAGLKDTTTLADMSPEIGALDEQVIAVDDELHAVMASMPDDGWELDSDREAAAERIDALNAERGHLASVEKTIQLKAMMAGLRYKLLLRAIPANIAHTGAGYYAVDVGGSTTSDTVGAYDENVIPQSEDFGTTWGLTNVTATMDAVANPVSGKQTADKIQSNGASGRVTQRFNLGGAAGGAHVFSVYLKHGNISTYGSTSRLYIYNYTQVKAALVVEYDLDAGTVNLVTGTSAGIVDLGDGWFRVWGVTAAADMANGDDVSPRIYLSSNSGEYVHAWGVQLEQAGAVSTYKPTRGATDTSITLQTGGLTDGDHDGELLNFTVADNDFQVIRSGEDSILVVGDATGEGGAATALTFTPHVTIQGGEDQVFTDQGAAAFTLLQIVRFYAGTYDENVVPNASLNPDEKLGYLLVLEGDPDDDRENMILAPSTGRAIMINGPDSPVFRHFRMVTVDDWAARFQAGSPKVELDDLDIECPNGFYLFGAGVTMRDITFTLTAYAGGQYCVICSGAGGAVLAERITFDCRAIADGYGFRGANSYGNRFEACRFLGCYLGYYGASTDTGLSFANCVFKVAAAKGIQVSHQNTTDIVRLVNVVFDGVKYPITFQQTGSWPDESAARIGSRLVLRSTYFYNFTSVGYDGTTGKTLAELEAFNRVESSGNVSGVDPKIDALGMTAADSPLPNAGIGAGVASDVNGVAAASMAHPAIGCDYSRDVASLTAPSLRVEVLSATSVRATFSDTVTGTATNELRYVTQADGRGWLDGGDRVGDGTLDLAGLTAGTTYYFVGWSEIEGIASPPSQVIVLTVGIGSDSDPEAAVWKLLTDDVDVSGVVAKRVYPGQAPVKAAGVSSLPFIVFQRIAGDPRHHMAAASGLAFARIQVESYAATYAAVKALAKKVKLALDGRRGDVTDADGNILEDAKIRMLSDQDGVPVPTGGRGKGIYRLLQDFGVSYKETVPTF